MNVTDNHRRDKRVFFGKNMDTRHLPRKVTGTLLMSVPLQCRDHTCHSATDGKETVFQKKKNASFARSHVCTLTYEQVSENRIPGHRRI